MNVLYLEASMRFLLLIALFTIAHDGVAQVKSEAVVAPTISAVPRHSATRLAPAIEPPVHSRVLVRTGAGLLGWAAGALVGAAVGYQLMDYCNGCEDPGLEQVLVGATAGGALGAALVAPGPAFGDGCAYEDRVGGSFLGASIGGALGLGLIRLEAGLSLSVPLFTAGGAAVGTLVCRPPVSSPPRPLLAGDTTPARVGKENGGNDHQERWNLTLRRRIT